MFFAQNEYGSARLFAAYDSLPIVRAHKLRDTAKFLGVTERTLSSWLTGKTDPPRAVVYAIWHESPAGRAATTAHSEQAAHLWRTLAKSQEQQVKRLEQKIDTLTDAINEQKLTARAPVAANELFFRRY